MSLVVGYVPPHRQISTRVTETAVPHHSLRTEWHAPHVAEHRARRRLLVALPAIALAASSLTVTGSAAAQPARSAPVTIGADEHYINYAEPEVQPDTGGKEVKGRDGIFSSPADEARAYDRKYAGGNPIAARELARLEASPSAPARALGRSRRPRARRPPSC
ncbi:hypothetical protein [Micromonospora sp. b486]|uniref:hypothetical protein n=1 Tax=Micromonospora sp. b486 TaxID=3053986 RepID=UPI00259D0CD8|nr:hypothetical protein [Micromonospora sp. b486]MDM4784481.1 hypothetical protein [Micromonospora sp. b486]